MLSSILLKDKFYKNNPDYIKNFKSTANNKDIHSIINSIDKYKKFVTQSYINRLNKYFDKKTTFDELQKKLGKVSGSVYSVPDALSGEADTYVNPAAPPSSRGRAGRLSRCPSRRNRPCPTG